MEPSPNPTTPVVSIITPCLNGLPYLDQCVQSVVAQSFGNWELSIIDDGSTDGSADLAQEWTTRDSRIRLLRTTGRAGASRARNLGIRHARGRYIAFLDCDDWWLPEKLEQQLSAMSAQGAGFCCSPYNVCTDNGTFIRVQRVQSPISTKRYVYKRFVIGCLTVLVDREKVGAFVFPEHLQAAEDVVLWYQLLVRCDKLQLPTVCTASPVANYRVHSGGKSSSKIPHALAHWRVYKNELGLPLFVAVIGFLAYAANGVWERMRPQKR
jgi:teichuronic acid biosynthesis glycosyltransferase TuaG